MAIATTINGKTVFGNKRVHYGTSVLSAGSSSGAVVTGLARIDSMDVTVKGDTQQGSSLNGTLPLSTGSATVVVETANSTFYWKATGK